MSETNIARVPGKQLDTWDPGELSIWYYVNVLLRGRYLLLLLPLAFGIAVGTMSLMSPRKYVASTTFVPQEAGQPQSGLGQLASQFGVSVARATTSSPQFYADLLQSRDLLRDAVQTVYRLPGSPPFSGTYVQYLRIANPGSSAATAAAVQSLRSSLDINTDRITGVVHLSVSTRSPGLSAQVANRLLALLNDYNLRRRQSQARAEREFLEQRVGVAKAELNAADNTLTDFYGHNRNFSNAPELRAEEQRLQRQLLQKQSLFTSLAGNLEAAKIEEVRNSPVITVIDRPDGFVEPQPRGTAGKVVMALFGGLFLAVALAFVREYFRRQRREGGAGYEEFVALCRATFMDVRRPFASRN